MLILILFVPAGDASPRTNTQKLNRSAFETANNGAALEIDVVGVFGLQLDAAEEVAVFGVGPGVEEGQEDFVSRCHGVPETPLDPPLVVLLNPPTGTMRPKSTGWAMRFHSSAPSSRYTGTSPSCRRRDFILRDVPGSACCGC